VLDRHKYTYHALSPYVILFQCLQPCFLFSFEEFQLKRGNYISQVNRITPRIVTICLCDLNILNIDFVSYVIVHSKLVDIEAKFFVCYLLLKT
jgi:hypothetical protein